MKMERAVLLALLISAAFWWRKPSAYAEFWTSTMGQLLRDARSVEVVSVTSVAPSQWTYRVESSVRGRPAGSVGTLPSWGLQPVAVGARLLLVCEQNQCPRAVGFSMGNAWNLHAQEPGDGAAVLPSLVDQASLALLAAGRTAPRLCVRASLAYLDAPAVRETLRMEFAADNGQGTVTAPPSMAGATAHFSFGSRGGHFAFALNRPGGTVSLETSGPVSTLARSADGCFEIPVYPAHPLARTPAEFQERLRGSSAPLTLGRGTLRVSAGAPVLAGVRSASLLAGNTLALSVERAFEGRGVHSMQLQGTSLRVGFALEDDPSRGELVVELPGGGDSLERRVAEVLRAGRAQFPVFLRRGSAPLQPLGTLELAHP